MNEKKGSKRKNLGGAEKIRKKNNKLLLASAKQCLTLNEMFTKSAQQVLDKKVNNLFLFTYFSLTSFK